MNPLLVVDIGNTSTKVAAWRDGAVRGVKTRPTQEIVSKPETISELIPATNRQGLDIAVCSVVSEIELVLTKWCKRNKRNFSFIRGDTATPLRNLYKNPSQLGPDRLAAAVGAVNRLGVPVIVVSLGTATVMDVVNANNEFIGGAIMVGLETGLAALAEHTSSLPLISPKASKTLIGRDTKQCLQVGAIVGTAAQIEGTVIRFQSLLGEPAPVALTGGFAELIAPNLSIATEIFPHLALEGIGVIWHYHYGKRK